MFDYCVIEYADGKQTGREWPVRATDAKQAAFEALGLRLIDKGIPGALKAQVVRLDQQIAPEVVWLYETMGAR